MTPLSVPVLELLQSFPLVLIVADELGGGHDVVPVVVDADVGDPDFFEKTEDLDSGCGTSLMILMPVFLKKTAEMAGDTPLMSSAACSSLNRFSIIRFSPSCRINSMKLYL